MQSKFTAFAADVSIGISISTVFAAVRKWRRRRCYG